MILLLTILMLTLSGICLIAMGITLYRTPRLKLPFSTYVKLGISGVVAFIADTFGVGSFAVNVAFSKLLNTFKDDELPGAVNGAQVLPGIFESIFFMQMVEVDMTTLLVLVAGTCIGGVLGGNVVSRLSKQAIRSVMIVCFVVLISLLASYQLGLMPLGGEALALSGVKLTIGFFAMIACGALTSAGVGLFVLVQSVLFLMGVSPEVAFPIMTTAGAMQQPLTTLVFLKQGKIPLQKAMMLSVAGCLGVLIALPVFNALSNEALRFLLMLVLIFNAITMMRAYLRTRADNLQASFA